MEKVNLPNQKAHEPNEEAHQPLEQTMTPKQGKKHSKKLITFADDTEGEKFPSQPCSNNYKDVLSQPAVGISHRQKLLWLQKRRTPGLWVQCDDCRNWRYIPDAVDSYELPKRWYCRMNPDTANGDCSIPETPIPVRDEEDLIYSEYSTGSIVWARMAGFPWWPAMVDDCPDTEQFYWLDGFSDIPTHYNVVFFDSTEVTRGWIAPDNLKPYTIYKKSFKPFLKDKKYTTRLREAIAQADTASKIPLHERLEKYSFLARYKGNINTPKKINKNVIKKQINILKRKFNIDIEESFSEDDDIPETPKNKNVDLAKSKKAKNGKRKVISKNVVGKISIDEKSLGNESSETILHDNTNLEELNGETQKNTDISTENKKLSSLAVQVGSKDESAAMEPFDDDTSKTYVPEGSQESTQQTQDFTATNTSQLQVTVTQSPRSDDFDFN